MTRAHRRKCASELLLADAGAHGICPRMLGFGQAGHRRPARRGGSHKLRPPVCGILRVSRPLLRDEDVSDPLHTLPGQPEPDTPSDLGDGQRLSQGGTKHLPPGGR